MKKPGGLTRRQAEVVSLYADGQTTKAIAQSLHISQKTVEYHRSKIYMKLKLDNLVSLTKWAIRAGLTSLACMAMTSAAAQPFLFPTNPVPVVQLAWSIVGSATNYNLYYGVVTGGYTNKTPVGPVLNATLPLPARGVKFFFAVTAQSGGLESPFSNEVSYTAPAPPPAPVQQPVIVLVVQSGQNPAGGFNDTGMNWALSPSQSELYYRLRIAKTFIPAATLPPMPSK